jgi:hypothetical protein
MGNKNESAISRREFARRAAIVSAAASLTPANLLGSELSSPPPLPQQPPGGPKLSPQSQIEVDSRIQSILAQYGSRLSEAQKTEMRRLATEAQAPLDRLRAYLVENGDGPALYLKPLIEREKKPTQASPYPKTGTAPKNS